MLVEVMVMVMVTVVCRSDQRRKRPRDMGSMVQQLQPCHRAWRSGCWHTKVLHGHCCHFSHRITTIPITVIITTEQLS